MAGETTKSTRLTNVEASLPYPGRLGHGRVRRAQDSEAIAATELEAADVTLFNITVPSNGVHDSIEIYNDDLDSNCAPTLTIDVGLFAAQRFKSVTSGTVTDHAKDAVLDADLLVDGSTEGQSANTDWVRLVPDSSTYGPEDACKEYWELLGYDKDPQCDFRIGITFAAAAATAAAGDLAIRVNYSVD